MTRSRTRKQKSGATMYKTSQPNPEKSQNDRGIVDFSKAEPQFETIVDFSEWIEEQLSKLELRHQRFSTSDSVRLFFKRD